MARPTTGAVVVDMADARVAYGYDGDRPSSGPLSTRRLMTVPLAVVTYAGRPSCLMVG
jgi:hypothetical protein